MKKSRHLTLTASAIRAYKSCPRLYELQYVHQLKPAKTPEALEVGANFHNELERLFKGEPFEGEGLPRIMAEAFAKYSPWREWGIAEVEREFSMKVTPFLTLAGKIDAVGNDGSVMEFKTTSSAVDENSLSGLKFAAGFNWSDQITTYCLAARVRKVKVAAIQKPSIRRKQGETEEEYLDRCRAWYDECKIRAFDVFRTDGQVEALEAEIRMLASEIRRRKQFYRNPSHCALTGCPFESICLRRDLGDLNGLVGFVRKEKENEELIGA